MNPAPITLTPTLARRLAITRQHLAGPRRAPDASGIMAVTRDLGCLQLDPTNAVARSHLLVLWSRLGAYDPAALDPLLWEDRRLFEYWAHAASIVLTEHYPIHRWTMRPYAERDIGGQQRIHRWMETNAALRDHILDELRARGPLLSKQFDDKAVEPWSSTGWTANQNVSRMLGFLVNEGKIMVAGRQGAQRLWDLTERVLPDWAPRTVLDSHEVVREAAQIALRALGVARAAHIEEHFTRGRYPDLPAVLAGLEAEGRVRRAVIVDDGPPWPGEWYVHSADLPLLERLREGEWQPRTTLLSPFDNLIADRERTRTLFGFDFRLEIYVPKGQRRHGYYVLPILHGDRLIGRIDPLFDRKQGVLRVNAVHLEPDTLRTPAIEAAIDEAIAALAAWLGAAEIERAPTQPT